MLKQNTFSRLILPILVLVLILGVGVGMALAGRSDNGEGDHESPINNDLSQNHIEVTGVGPAQSPTNFNPNAEGAPENQIPAFSQDDEELVPEPNSNNQAQFFKRIAGSNFSPRDSDSSFTYGGGGCFYRDSTAGDSWYTTDIQVPDGAVIDFLRVYYYDADNLGDINSELWAFDGAGGTTLIAEADSSGSGGYDSAGSGFFEHTVDNLNQSLVVVTSFAGSASSTLQNCGIRIRYQYELPSANFLPAVLNLTNP
jgi:hypothetical protein